MLKINMKLFKRSNGYWYIRFERGKEKSLRTKDKKLAERLFKEIQKEVLKGKIILLEKQANPFLKDAIEEYLNWSQLHKKENTIARDKNVFKNFLEFMGNAKLRSVTPKEIESYIQFLKNKGRKVAGINLELRVLKAFFNKLKDWGYVKENPVSKVKPLREIQKMPRFISEEDMLKILKFIKDRDEDFYDYVVLLLETGCRRNEILYLTPKQVDFKNGVMVVFGKGSKERIVPLTDRALKILEKRRFFKGRMFSKWTANWVSKKWKEIMKKLGMDYRLHDLRHTTASWLALRGVPIQFISELLGHTSLNITQIYAHLRPAEIREALNQLFQGFWNAVNFQAEGIENEKK